MDQASPQHGPNPAGLTFGRFAERSAGRSPAQVNAAFDDLPADQQRACWADLAARCQRRIEGEAYDPILDYEPPPRRARPATRARSVTNASGTPTGPHDDPLLEIDSAVYFEALTGVEVPRNGMVRCPLPRHEDRSPSLKVYDGDEGWFCFGCLRGGTIYSLAAELWDYPQPLRGHAFLAVRDRLSETFTAVAERAGR